MLYVISQKLITRTFIFSFGLLQGNFLNEAGLIQTEEQKARDMLNDGNDKVSELSKKNLKHFLLTSLNINKVSNIIVHNEMIKSL